MTQEILTRETLRELLTYDLNTGVFMWAKGRYGVRLEKPAGEAPHHSGYSFISILNRKYAKHRLAFLYVLGWMPEQVDHINHIRDDNRWINLRQSHKSDNLRNKSLYKNNKSGFVGVCYEKSSGKWRAHIRVDGKRICLGRHKDKSSAIAARIEADIKYNFHPNHGD